MGFLLQSLRTRQGSSRETSGSAHFVFFETLSIVQHLGLTTAEKKDVAKIIEALQRYVDGHLNETVERRNFRRRVQQPGETFDDFLISLRELTKTCKYCTDSCTEKSIQDQIIEGIRDGDTVKELLQENNLTLATTITKCHSKEAARKNRLDIVTQESEVVAALRRPPQPTHHTPHATCPDCGSATHRGGRRYCPAYDQTCSYCHKVGHFARVCRSKATKNDNPQPQHQPSTNAIRVQSQQPNQHQYMQLYKVQDGKTEAAPTITVRMSSSTGVRYLDVLPDSGADISAAGQDVLTLLGQHVGNIPPSSISPRTINGLSMMPLGKVPVTIQLGKAIYKDDLHIYPGVWSINILEGSKRSWNTAPTISLSRPMVR